MDKKEITSGEQVSINHEHVVHSVPPVVSAPVAQPLPEVQKKKGSGWGAFLLVFTLLFIPVVACCGFFYLVASLDSKSGSNGNGLDYAYVYGNKESENKILSIKIDSTILTEGQNATDPFSSLLSVPYVYGYSVKEELMKAADDASIKGVILEINSPGGTVVGSQAITDGIAYYKEKTKKPVYAYVQDLAASGGYWAAASADKIFADSGTLVGSIGVIFGPFEYYDRVVAMGSVSTDNGITVDYITGGTYKDFGNPFRKMSAEEATIMQREINFEYDNFVAHVSKHRNIAPNVIRREIKSLVYGVKTAKDFGLIDEIGSRETSYDQVANAASVGSNYQIVRQTLSGSLFSSLLAKSSEKTTNTEFVNKCILCGQMLYLYGDPTQYQLVTK